MSDTLEALIEETGNSMRKSVKHLEAELLKIRAGKASPNIVDGIMVEYYGNPTPLNQVANVTVTDSRTVTLQPWEKSMISPIERAIMASNIGLTPQNDGSVIRLFLPPLTEERRKELVKKAYVEGENGKVSVRGIRREAIESIKKMQKDGLSEDIAKGSEARVQGLTDKYIAAIDEHCKEKEKEIMTI